MPPDVAAALGALRNRIDGEVAFGAGAVRGRMWHATGRQAHHFAEIVKRHIDG